MKKNFVYLIGIFLLMTCIIAFGRIAGNDFITFDDPGFIIENPHIQHGLNMGNIQWAFTATHEGNWNPLVWFSLALEWSLFGGKASGYHIISLLLHIGGVIFLFLFLYKTTQNLWPATFAAAFFAIHPLRVESVAWAAERKDVLSMFFGMATLYAYAFYTQQSNRFRYFLCLILFAMALMSKPMLVTLPVVMLLMDYWPLVRWQKTQDKQTKRFNTAGALIKEKIPFVFLSICAGAMTLWAQNKEGAVASADSLPFVVRSLNAVVSYVTYLKKIFWPSDLAIFYPYKFNLSFGEVFVSGMILILMTFMVLYGMKKWPFLFVGWFWYLLTLMPVIGLIQVGSQAMADRYTYLPSVGIVIMLSWGVPRLFQGEIIRKAVLLPAGMVVIAVLALLTWQQCGYWKNGSELFTHALQVTKDNFLARHHLGLALYDEGKYKEAIDHYNYCISMEPEDAAFRHNRGLVFIKLGEYQKAIDDFNDAINLNPAYVDAYSNRGKVYFHTGNDQKAIEDFNAVVHLKKTDATAYYNRGMTYARIGRHQKAIDDLNEVIRLQPDFVDAYNNRAVAFFKLQNKKSGCRDAQKACAWGECTTLKLAQNKGYCR
ncbi:MAG: tetratricopeptide repeat protein [Smithella sp.]|nr:tetratricopeptide repeat protein [Smithella sp.]